MPPSASYQPPHAPDLRWRPLAAWRAAGWALLLCTMLATGAAAQAKDVLRVLAWPGYADADVVKAFEQRHGVQVEVTLVATDDVLREKLADTKGPAFDVFAANTAELKGYIDQKRVAPLTLTQIPNAQGQLPRFRNRQAIPGITRGEAVYAIAFTYSEMGLIYDRRQFSQPPASWAEMWNPKYRGKVLAYDGSTHNFSLAAQHLGLAPFRIEAPQFLKVAQSLVALRRNLLGFYTQPEDAVELFRRHSVALLFGNYGRQQIKQLRDAGLDVGYVIPAEGALAWLDCWAVTSNARQPLLAQRWIDYMLEPAVSREFSRRQGLANTLEEPAGAQPTEKIIWLEPVEDEKRRAQLWRRIVSGDQPGKF